MNKAVWEVKAFGGAVLDKPYVSIHPSYQHY